jgi:hypothetical protein
MAGLTADPSTAAKWFPPHERILLGAALALVVTYTGRQAAKDLLLDFLRRGLIRWGYQRRMGGYPYPHKSEAQIWSLKFFDDLGLHKYIDLDWDSHCITSTLLDKNGQPFRYKLFLIYLHHGDVLDMLRAVGLLPFEQEPAPALEQEQAGTLEQEPPSVPEAQEDLDVSAAPDGPPIVQKKPRRQPQADKVRWAFGQVYPNGPIPDEISDKALMTKIENAFEEAGKEIGKPPSDDVVRIVRKEWNARKDWRPIS